MGKVVKGLLGIVGLGGGAKKVSGAASNAVDAGLKKSKRRRSTLFQTGGGISGQELAPNQISRRDTILGN